MYLDKSIAIITPARYGSARLPGRPLKLISGQPVIQWVYEVARRSALADTVIVATDDKRIYKIARAFGATIWMTGINQLRVLEHGFPIQPYYTAYYDTSVDTPNSLAEARKLAPHKNFSLRDEHVF